MAPTPSNALAGTRVLVVGAGIGGLAVALALQRRGFDVVVYERASELREIGAGVIIQPNGRRVLADLGVHDALAARSSCVTSMYSCDYATGEVIDKADNAAVARRYGTPSLAVHCADLHGVLLEAVLANDFGAVDAGHDFASLDQHGGGVEVRFANGVADRAADVIGADGISVLGRAFAASRPPLSRRGLPAPPASADRCGGAARSDRRARAAANS